jgi:hypothetical protein
VSLGFEDGVPPEHVFAAGLDDAAGALAHEEAGLRAWALAERVDALGVARLVLETLQHPHQALPAHLVQERLAKA